MSTATTIWPEPEPGSGTDDGAGDPGGDPNAPDPDLGPGTTTTATLNNLYTADGDRLLRTAPDGSITLYVGGQEVTKSASGQVSAVRYYSFAGQTVAMRTAPGLGGVTSLVNDPHGTPVASVHNTDWTTTSVDKHYTLPFGGSRGGAEMPGDRAFLGKTKDAATGLTLVGARWYDEAAGRFLSVDPVMDMADPQQWNGYAYAGSNPTTWSDPTGLKPDGCGNTCVYYGGEWGVGGGKSDLRPGGGTGSGGGGGPAPTGPSSDPDGAGVTDNTAIDLCKVLFLCPGTEEPINYPKWLDDFDLAADRKWLEMGDGLDAFAELTLACLLDAYECDEFAWMIESMPEATVEGTVADAQEISDAFAAGDAAEGAGLASVFIIGVVSVKGVGKGVGGAGGAASKSKASVNSVETYAPKPLKPGDAISRWEEFLGPGDHTNLHPRTGLPDSDRLVSADGLRSIRFGSHEMGSSPTKFHFHEESWNFDDAAGVWNVQNIVVRVPMPKGTW